MPDPIPAEEHYRRLERMYHQAAINAWHQPALQVSEGRAEVVVTVRPDFFHAAHAMHGALYFKSLDDSSFFAANSLVFDVFVLTVTFNIVLLRPVAEGIITAHGRLMHRSKSMLVAESELRDAQGRTLARGGGTFAYSTIPLGPEVGYR